VVLLAGELGVAPCKTLARTVRAESARSSIDWGEIRGTGAVVDTAHTFAFGLRPAATTRIARGVDEIERYNRPGNDYA